MFKTSMIIPTYNASELLAECITSIRAYTDSPYEIIVIDNGSNDGTDQYCRKERLTFVSLPWKQPVAVAYNVGLKLSVGENLLLLKPNVRVVSDFQSEMMQYLNSKDGIGLVRPTIKGKTKYTPAGQWLQDENAPELGLFLFREIQQKIGFFQHSYVFGERLFDDYCFRASQAGYGVLTAGSMLINQSSEKGNKAGHSRSLESGNGHLFPDIHGVHVLQK